VGGENTVIRWGLPLQAVNLPMSPENPKLRDDLVISQQESKEGIGFVVKDPETSRFFRLKEIEHFIATQLNGSTDRDTTRRNVEEKFGISLSAEALDKFIQGLERLGLLEKNGASSGSQAQKPKTVRGNLLYLRFKAFDPDKLFSRLIKPKLVRFFFTPYFLLLSALGIVVAAGITVADWQEIGRDIQGLYHFQAFFFAWLTVFLVIVAHEFAHGLACKFFGGEVHEIGFLLLYFQPAFYCNVSDAWLFPEKSKRLWVTFAGAYIEVFIWSLATVIWRITETGTWVSFVALIIMATSGIKTLFNLNPLIKLDGYYLLSDFLEVPNLRRKSFDYIGHRLKQLCGSASESTNTTSERERRIYMIYGLLAGTFSFWLLGFVTIRLGHFLIGRYQAIGFILLVLFVLSLFRQRLTRLLKHRPILSKASYPWFASMPRRAKLLLFLTLALGLLFFGEMELKIAGEFAVLPIQNSDVRAEVEGIIQEVYADEGDVVAKGTLIARLSDRDPQADLRKITAEIQEKQAKLKMLKAGTRLEEIELARQETITAKTRVDEASKYYQESKEMRSERLLKAKIAIDKAKERLKYADQRFGMFKALYTKQMISLKEFEEAEENAAVRLKEFEETEAELKLVLADDLGEQRKALKLAAKEIEEKQAKLKLALAGSRPEEIEATEAEITRLEAQHRYTSDQIQLLSVVSPMAGLITTPKLKEKIGQSVKKGDLIAQVHELKTVRAEISVPENEFGDVRVGQDVVIKARAFPYKSFYGKISSLATTATKPENGEASRTVLVTTQIDNEGYLLRPEMTGNAKIYCGKRRVIDLMTRRFANYIRVEFWSWW
jgi:putative peptide zinc metalloprotease protein